MGNEVYGQFQLDVFGSDNGSEFRSGEFTTALAELGIKHRCTRPGRPTENAHVERLQHTILEECWRAAFARSLIPKIGGLSRDLDTYLTTYNHDRAHTGRLTQGAVPADLLYGARKTRA